MKKMFLAIPLALAAMGTATTTASGLQTHGSTVRAVKNKAMTRYGEFGIVVACDPVSLADGRNRAHVWTCGWHGAKGDPCSGGMRISGRPDASPGYNQYRARAFVYACHGR